MSIRNNLFNRLDINNDSDDYQLFDEQHQSLTNLQTRLVARGGTDQWTRMREDKLRTFKKALLSSYQSAIVQKYDVNRDTLAVKIKNIVYALENDQELTEDQQEILQELEEEHLFLSNNKNSYVYQKTLIDIANRLISYQPYFRCLINHDKLKVDYEDKIISIPFSECPIGKMDPIDTDFHNGTVFKWVHGNKQEWTPDTYWIVYMQYSQETAYFRAEIRKADEEIEIITIDSEGNENSVTYRGWMTGPNETTAMWNVKKGVVWNDMNYTKLLYITKDEDTLAFFKRFDRVIINGKPWEIQAYNESYTSTKYANYESGIIRVALKETYTSSNQFIKESLNAAAQAEEIQTQNDATYTDARIDGPTKVYPYDIITYTAKNYDEVLNWSISDSTLAKIKSISQDGTTAIIQIITGVSNIDGFDIKYGDDIVHITIASF